MKGNGDVEFLSNLSRHDKAVNIVRFSNDGSLLASGGDGEYVAIAIATSPSYIERPGRHTKSGLLWFYYIVV